MQHAIARFFYFITWPFWRGIFGFFTHLKIVYKGKKLNRLEKRSTIIIINHMTWFDPFLAGMFIPFYSSIFPIRYVTARKAFLIPILGQVLWLYGCIKIKRGVGLETSLKKSIKILRKGGTIGIFPEGKRRKHGRPRKSRRGTAFLVSKTSPTIIPVYIKGIHNISFKEFIFRKRKAKLYIGESFKISAKMKKEISLEELAEFILSKLKELKHETNT